jgi:hypothetical protein
LRGPLLFVTFCFRMALIRRVASITCLAWSRRSSLSSAVRTLRISRPHSTMSTGHLPAYVVIIFIIIIISFLVLVSFLVFDNVTRIGSASYY